MGRVASLRPIGDRPARCHYSRARLLAAAAWFGLEADKVGKDARNHWIAGPGEGPLQPPYTVGMNVHIADIAVDQSGGLRLDDLPFSPGEHVEVIVRSRGTPARTPVGLTGSVLRYDRPFEPVAQQDWEADGKPAV